MTNNNQPGKQNTLLNADWRNLPFKDEHLDNYQWHPGKWEDVSYMGKESYESALKEWQDAENKVVFENVVVEYDACDCGDGYGCSHGSYPTGIRLSNAGEHFADYEGYDRLFMENNDTCVTLNKLYSRTLGEFYDACKLIGIELKVKQEYANQAGTAAPTVAGQEWREAEDWKEALELACYHHVHLHDWDNEIVAEKSFKAGVALAKEYLDTNVIAPLQSRIRELEREREQAKGLNK